MGEVVNDDERDTAIGPGLRVVQTSLAGHLGTEVTTTTQRTVPSHQRQSFASEYGITQGWRRFAESFSGSERAGSSLWISDRPYDTSSEVSGCRFEELF